MLDSLRPDNWDKRWWIYPVACLGAIYLGYWVLRTPNTGAAILAGVVFALICLAFVARNHEDRKFLVRLFLGALCARWAVGIFIDSYPLMRPLVGDAYTYDAFGNVLCQSWQGLVVLKAPGWLLRRTLTSLAGGCFIILPQSITSSDRTCWRRHLLRRHWELQLLLSFTKS